MTEMFGRTMEELTGCEYVELGHPSEREAGRRKMLALLASEIASVDLERRYWRKDGSEFWGHLVGKRFHDDRGIDIGLIGVISDIDKRKQAEGRLKESETRLNTILDNVGAFIFIKDTRYRYSYVNRKVAELFGVSAKEILGNRDDAFFSRTSVEEIMRSDRPAIERGAMISREETDLSSADGIPRTYWTVKLPLRDGDGAITGLCGIYSDITARKRAEEALKESEEKFKALVETSCDWIWEVNEQGVYTYASPRVQNILGYSAEEVVGRTPLDFMPPEERVRVAARFREIMASREPLVGLENTNLRKDGRRVILETSGMPKFDDAGVFKGYRGIDRDITEWSWQRDYA